MKPRISGLLTRWRHTLGYGVHSPLAYRIVKECIRPDELYAFYADSRIDSTFAADRMRRKSMRMLVRLIHQLRPQGVWIAQRDNEVAGMLREIFPDLPVAAGGKCPEISDFIVNFGGKDPMPAWRGAAGNADLTMADFGEKERKEIADATLVMEGSGYAIYARRAGMMRVEYQLL